jgi:hypothetical protein
MVQASLLFSGKASAAWAALAADSIAGLKAGRARSGSDDPRRFARSMGGAMFAVITAAQVIAIAWVAKTGWTMASGLTTRSVGRHGPSSFPNVLNYLSAHAAPGSVVGATLQMAPHIRLQTDFPGVVHPHAENAELRAKATQFYKIFGYTEVAEVHGIMREMGVDYVVFDRYSVRTLPGG